MKPVIREVIVVEGRNDTAKLKQYYTCETIETGGTSLGEDVLERIREARKTRGVIVFTDPDSPGNRIRHAVNSAVPGCKNAFVDKYEARTEKKVGVEHASGESLKAALEHLVTYGEQESALTMKDMADLGLTGYPDSRKKRDMIGKKYHIGNANAKTMLERINFAGIGKKELEEALHE